MRKRVARYELGKDVIFISYVFLRYLVKQGVRAGGRVQTGVGAGVGVGVRVFSFL